MASIDERIEKQAQKAAQEKAKLARLQQLKKKEVRKARTRRLIEHGALAEKYLRCPDMATVDFEKLLAQIVTFPQVQNLLPDVGQGEQGPTEYKTKSGHVVTDATLERLGDAIEKGDYPGGAGNDGPQTETE